MRLMQAENPAALDSPFLKITAHPVLAEGEDGRFSLMVTG